MFCDFRSICCRTELNAFPAASQEASCLLRQPIALLGLTYETSRALSPSAAFMAFRTATALESGGKRRCISKSWRSWAFAFTPTGQFSHDIGEALTYVFADQPFEVFAVETIVHAEKDGNTRTMW